MTDPIRVLGLDLSLTSTGCAKAWGGVLVPPPVTFRVTPGPATGFARMHAMLGQLGRVVAEFDPDLVVTEGQALMARGAYHLENSGLWWNVMYRIWKSGRPLAVVPIPTLKRFATGRAKDVDKGDMRIAACRRFGLDRIQADEADALWLAAAGCQQYGWPICQLPDSQVAVLSQHGKNGPLIRWPPTLKPPRQAAAS